VREELFITTKLWNDGHDYFSAFRKIGDSLERLNMEYVDLYLIHWLIWAGWIAHTDWDTTRRYRQSAQARLRR